MRWVTRRGVHIDRSASAWLLRRFVDPDAEFLTDPVLWELAEAVHEADLEDDRYDAPDAPGLDAILRGLSMTLDDPAVLAVTAPVFDGLYEYYRRAVLLDRPPA